MGNICEVLNCEFYQQNQTDDDFMQMRKLLLFM